MVYFDSKINKTLLYEPSVMDDKLNYTLKKNPKPWHTLNFISLWILILAFYLTLSHHLSCLLFFAWVLQNAPSLSGSPLQPIILSQRELLPISCSLQEFLHAANLCLSCTEHCSGVCLISLIQAQVSEGPREPLINAPSSASSSSEALRVTGVLFEVCSKQHKKLLPPISFIDSLTWLM